MKVKINAYFDGYVTVDTVSEAVEWHVTEVQSFDAPWVTVEDLDGDTIADDERRDIERAAATKLEDGSEDTDAVRAVYALKKADDILGKGGYFPPYHANDAAVVAFTEEWKAKRKDNLIAMIEGGNTHAIRILKDEYGIDVKLRVEVVGEAA